MSIAVVCPECDKSLKVPDAQAGKKIRCPHCKGVVPVPADEDERDEEDDRSARPAKASRRDEDEEEEDEERPRGGSKKGLWIGVGVGSVLLIGLVVGLIFAFRGKGGGTSGPTEDPNANPRVTKGNYQAISPRMPRAKVEEILGKGTPTDVDEAEQWLRDLQSKRADTIRGLANQARVRSWYVWCNGESRIYVAFGEPFAGERAGFTFWASREGIGGGTGHYYSQLVHTGEGVDADFSLDAFAADPRFLKEGVKAAVIGEWRNSGDICRFQEDGKMSVTIGGKRTNSTFTFQDERNLEAKLFVGNPPRPRTVVYRPLIDGDTLYLAQMNGDKVRSLQGPFQRAK
jgi:hypothetical protein